MPDSSNHPAPLPLKGWVLYDGDCTICIRLIRRLEPLLAKVHLETAPLQTEWVKERLGYTDPAQREALLKEMRVLTNTGQIYGGADAVLYLAGQFWWAMPLVWLSCFPGFKTLLNLGYRWVAANRHCSAQGCSIKR